MSENHLSERDVRLQKLDHLREAGIEPYPYLYEPTHQFSSLREEWESKLEDGEKGDLVKVSGRVMGKRGKGKMTFLDLQDATGRIQGMLMKNRMGEENYELLKQLDVGDIIGLEGQVCKTKVGELSIAADHFMMLAKALRPLPEKYHGLTDVDTRYRQRYVDLIVNPEVKQTFLVRSQALQMIRTFLAERQFMEVETPILHPIAGGAAARPFTTHHNALDMPFYLRIAPELYLKRLIVGGFERVFELNRVFRNEGVSTRHNPEFTMLELYQSYADYHTMMALTEDLVRDLVFKIHGSDTLTYQDTEINFKGPWARMTMLEAVCHFLDLTDADFATLDTAKAAAEKYNIEVKSSWGIGKIMNELFESVDTKLIQPTFIIDYPREISPLAKAHRDNPDLTERFELFIYGREMANAFSELNDPIDQLGRFENQLSAKADGDDEAHEMDHDYVQALEVGMPPTGGLGIGIDRLVMLLTDAPSIRDVLLFPHMRPQS